GETEQGRVKVALRNMEMSRTIYRRVQYVIGYSEPKLVYSLTPSGHRKAVSLRRRLQGLPDVSPDESPAYASAPEDPGMAPDTSSMPPIRE
ncbi:MAG: hypothetical protein ACHQ16_08635, partial [Candidatus Lutacidiplasmatales archaeon]